jgi:hypothetical protein
MDLGKIQVLMVTTVSFYAWNIRLFQMIKLRANQLINAKKNKNP